MNPVETYLKEMHEIRSTGGAVDETSYYGPLCNLLNEVGKSLKPNVKCINILKNTGAGNPDFGLFTANQYKGKDIESVKTQLPERGVIEAKPVSDDSWVTADSKQVSKYWKRYSQILVTNYRDFILIGRDDDGQPIKLETYHLADSDQAFWNSALHARKTAKEKGDSFIEYLQRVMQYLAALKNPADLAGVLASYAREARTRIEVVKDLPGLAMLRQGLEEALGMEFKEEKGEHFFRAVLVETLFYGIFSSWVIWSRNNKGKKHKQFNWHGAAWNLHVPMIASLFEQIATPKQLKPLGIDEVLDWTGMVLNRVDRSEFFRQFEEEHAVQYFYEPFLEAYDPELRKQLGVWYTPPEIVKYQVERIDTVLREELDIADGLADENVVVLDPCCGTGAYLVEVLKKMHQTLDGKGGDALTAQQLKKAAIHRIFGFEILPAPFVISHLQLGLLLRELGAPLSDKKNERVGVYLTNALTGWEPPKKPKNKLPFPELQEEKDAAEKVKREAPILVILGNPPYNAFAGTSPEEEGDLVEIYKGIYYIEEKTKRGKTKKIRKYKLNDPVKKGGWGIKKFNLDELYVRFFRIAERRIVKGGKGVVSYISNHSWVTEPSFVILREHLLDSYNKIWIENMHGDRKISEYGPDGRTSETIFAIPGFSVGIQQGVTTSLCVKTGADEEKPSSVLFRDDINASKATDRRKQLLQTLTEKNINRSYKKAQPTPENRFSFRPGQVSDDYMEWPLIHELCEVPLVHGPVERRANALIDIDRLNLSKRMKEYYDKNNRIGDLKEICYGLTRKAAGFDPAKARENALEKETYSESKLVKYLVKPLDRQWCYYTLSPTIWSRPCKEIFHQAWDGNLFIGTRPTGAAVPEGPPFVFSSILPDYQTIVRNISYVPVRLKTKKKKSKDDDGMTISFLDDGYKEEIKANLSEPARAYLKKLGLGDPDEHREVAELIWMHALAIGYSIAYLEENADGIRQDWPRIPLPKTQKTLVASALLGKQVASLLDTEAGVDGVTAGTVRKELSCIGLVSRVGGGTVNPDVGELDVTAGWSHAGKGGVCMPGKGKLITRPYSDEELKAIPAAQRALLGDETCDMYLNEKVFIKNVPANVWNYYIGGYQVIKKWLSYREKTMLGRGLTMDEAQYIREMTRRLSALILLGSELDKNYNAVCDNVYNWNEE